MPKAVPLQILRKVHLYFGLFISPALLFFAFTGAYQTLGLHEASVNYKPPSLLAELGQIHKKQTYLLPALRPDGPSPEGGRNTVPARGVEGGGRPEQAASPGPGRPAGGQPQPTLQVKQKQHLPLKLFFVLVSLGLFTSTVTGIVMAYVYGRNKLLVTGLLLAGLVLPLLLLRF